MKTTLLSCAAIILAACASATAQTAEPTPSTGLGLRASEPSVRNEPSVETGTSSTNYPKPGTPLNTPSPAATRAAATPAATATPRAVASPSPRATASPVPSPAKATASPSPSPAPRAAATPTPAVPKNAAAAVREMENRWATATSTHDVATIQGLLAGDYIGVTASGNVVNKAGLLAEIRRDKNTYTRVANSGLTVRVIGTTAIVVGTTKQQGKDATGKDFSFTYRWTDTWVERNGVWQCVASQSIRLQGE